MNSVRDEGTLVVRIREYLTEETVKYNGNATPEDQIALNVTDGLVKIILKLFLKSTDANNTNCDDDESSKRDGFVHSVQSVNNSLKKLDIKKLYGMLLGGQLKEKQDKETERDTQRDIEIGLSPVFKKRKRKLMIGSMDSSEQGSFSIKKKASLKVVQDDDDDDDDEADMFKIIGRTQGVKTKSTGFGSVKIGKESGDDTDSKNSHQSIQTQVTELESKIKSVGLRINDCIDDCALFTSGNNSSSSNNSNNKPTLYVENEVFKLTPIAVKERFKLIPPFLTKLNNKYHSGSLVQRKESDHLLKVIMGSLTQSGDSDSLQEGKVEISNDENGELTVGCTKSSKILMEYKKIVENKKHIKNIVLNDEQQQEQEAEEVVGDEDEEDRLIVDGEDLAKENDGQDNKFVDNSKNLPVYASKDDFLKVLKENQVVLVIGETGSGKTTQLPKYIYQQDPSANSIAVTQPRRVAAMTIAKRISQELHCKLGQEVGYSVRFDDKTTKNKTKIKIMTDGILLREFLTSTGNEDDLKYSHIIIDEAHERSLNTDILLGFIKKLLLSKKNRNLKIIITSATINYKVFLQNFPNAPIFKIKGKTFPVEPIFLKRPCVDYIESIIQTVVKLHLSNPIDGNNDILCFMTGQEDIEISCSVLQDKLEQVYAQQKQFINGPAGETDNNSNSNSNSHRDFVILPLYSTLSPQKQTKVFNRFPGKRKIIFSTNVAETSLTIDGIKFVIDAGFHKLKLYNSKIGLNILKTVPVSKDMSVQRQGRAGRTQPGIVYKMYTEACFNFELLKNSIPEIKRTNLSNVLLMLLNTESSNNSIDNILKFPFIEKPSKLTLLSSFLELYNLNAIDNSGKLTDLGAQMSRIPITPNLSKMLILSQDPKFNCLKEMLVIVGMLSIESNSGAFFQRPKNFEKIADTKRLNFIVPYSDHLTLLNLYSKWKYNNSSMKWCERNFINFKSLVKVEKIIDQLKGMMISGHRNLEDKTQRNIHSHKKSNTWENVKKCITTGYSYKNIGKKVGLNKYISLQNGMSLQIHPTSSLFGLPDLPPYIIYHDLLLTSKEYINCVTAVDPLWIMEYQPLYFNIDAVVDEESSDLVYRQQTVSMMKNLKQLNTDLLEKEQQLAGLKDQLEIELLKVSNKETENKYMDSISSLKTFKKRKKLGF